MKTYKFYNALLGWITFLIAAITYLLTIEPTTSFWDCGEFIAAAFKLEVGHPPGAPFFMILGRFFTLFADNPANAAKMMNILSALASAFTILFLFWTITHLVKKIISKANQELNIGELIAILGSGFVGALAYTFSDTFWFSAVEAEVYATSSLFTAVVFWAILKWENEADKKYSNRWLILIAYLMGLSIGVHLLNLLAIPAIVFVYYFKKYQVSKRGIFLALVISGIILGSIMYIIIPGVITVASWFDLLFVNGFRLPYNSGVLFYAVVLISLIIWGIRYTQRKEKVVLNTILLGFAVIMIGYSSYAMIIIRSIANPPMDQNSPDNAFDLLYYLNREQYGDNPLLYGQGFDAPMIENVKKGPVYIKKDGKYVIADYKVDVKFDPRFTTFFPRMYSADPGHVREYKKWVKISGKEIPVTYMGKTEKRTTLTLGDNLEFLFKYQLGHMYFRYFMWNFSGRQNDIQGHGNNLKGNWISGIPFIDNARLGDQEMVPDHLKSNPARNKYFMLPLLLGLAGLFFHYKKSKQDFAVVMMLFVLTGIAIVVYLNQYPIQPRERDYAFAGSFYAFTIWIGLGVAFLYEFLSRKIPSVLSAISIVLISVLFVPGIMAKENWDDHDRSGRYTARDLAYNYLNSCNENAILFTNGDNDTFPLWYAQEVEGIRTDIRVCNMSYLRASWYIDQMSRKAYESDPLPFSLTHDQTHRGNRDILPMIDRLGKPVDIKQVMAFVATDDSKAKITSPFDPTELINYIPAKQYKLDIDADEIVQKGIVSENKKSRIVNEIQWSIGSSYLYKDGLMILDIMANNDWKRPVYWAMTVPSSKYYNLQKYFKLDGLTFQLVPVEAQKDRFFDGEVDSEIMFDNMMNKFRWGGIETDIYLDENNIRMYSNLRSNFGRLADKLIEENKIDSALLVLDRCMDLMPENKIPFNNTMLPVISAYYSAGNVEKANQLVEILIEKMYLELDYYFSLDSKISRDISNEKQVNLYTLQEIYRITMNNKQDGLMKQIEEKFMVYMNLYNKNQS
ncbi:MAG: hypothetical protein A2W99_07940 [Bacteroidetes bacterium GWF2_33_16]|nr:MAG: hypothetical protein A2X00_10995 [Bacteroidetes bacterium GWE2_32_14]OFY03719.1 MAG: hypothetical protein A2W99_07940 [Bacteroidetes bacterium GWF2_33_16]